MTDDEILQQIKQLVDEEHRARQAGPAGVEQVARLEATLDQCWDLLRQRRAKEEFGLDPDEARVRDASVVEHYQQ